MRRVERMRSTLKTAPMVKMIDRVTFMLGLASSPPPARARARAALPPPRAQPSPARPC